MQQDTDDNGDPYESFIIVIQCGVLVLNQDAEIHFFLFQHINFYLWMSDQPDFYNCVIFIQNNAC